MQEKSHEGVKDGGNKKANPLGRGVPLPDTYSRKAVFSSRELRH
jgi:hypothetical protein